jgi:hypothetical protein
MATPITMKPETYAQLLKDQRALTDSLSNFDKLEECGEDCTTARAWVANQLDRISALIKNFAPNQMVR